MKKRRKRRYSLRAKLGAVLFAVMLLIAAAALIRTEKAVRPVAAQQAEHFSEITATAAINSAVTDFLSENRYIYSDFAAVLYDENGRAVSVEAITYNVNRLQSELSDRINSELQRAGSKSAEIPLGSLTGLYLLAGRGPGVNVRICPEGAAEVELTSSFSSAGVNQTCHRISAVVTAQMSSSIPLYSFETQTSMEFLIAENVIVGEIPETAISGVWAGKNI